MKTLREELYEIAVDATKSEAGAVAEELHSKIVSLCREEAKSGKFICVLSPDIVERITLCTELGKR